MTNESLQVKEFKIVRSEQPLFGKAVWKNTTGRPSDILASVNSWMAETGARIVAIESLTQHNSNIPADLRGHFDGVRVWCMVDCDGGMFDSETMYVVVD